MADLMRLLSAKQQLIVALQALEKELAPFHDEDPDSRRVVVAGRRAPRARPTPTQCRRLIAEVMALEQAGERQMTVRRDEAAGQLRTVDAAGRVREAYESQR